MRLFIFRILVLLIFIFGLLSLIWSGQVTAQDRETLNESLLQIIKQNAGSLNRGVYNVIPKINTPFSIHSDEASEVWKQASVWKLPWEINRGENRPPGDDTYVLMMSDDENIYVAFINYDSNVKQIRRTLTDRNAWELDNNDAVGLMLDTYNDGRNAYLIMVNAAGVQFDAIRLDRGAQGTEDDESFNFLWESSVRYFDLGYMVEMAIPFNQLQISSGGDTIDMGMLPFRLQPRDFNYRYNGVEWDFNRNCYICQFPTISVQHPGENVTGSHLQVVPYISGFMEGSGDGFNLSRHNRVHEGSAGLDVKYQRSNSVLDATLFPDFSQVETDAFQMTSNVRFLPQLTERRPFFMERADLFRLPIEETIYTRSIVDPAAGGRWTGKTDRHNWAVITMPDQTGWFIDPGSQESRLVADEGVNSWNNLFRYRYDRSADLMMGALYSDRITEDGYNRLLSHDGQFAISSNHTLETQLLGSWNRYPEYFADTYGVSTDPTFDYGYLLSFRRSGDQHGGVGHDYILETRRLGEDLVTGLGILQRTGIQQTLLVGGYNFWLDHRYIERIRPYIRSEGDWRLEDGKQLSGRNHMGVHLRGFNRSYIFIQLFHEREVVHRQVEGVERSGEFNLFSGRLRMETSITPDYFASVNFRRGEAVDFTLVEKMDWYEVSLVNELFLFGRRMELAHELEYMKLFHDEPAQEALTQHLRIDYQITGNYAVRNIIQYRNFRFHDPRYPESVPNRVRTVQNQMLLRYRLNYASALYLGGFVEFGEDFSRLGRVEMGERSQWQIFLKFSYLL